MQERQTNKEDLYLKLIRELSALDTISKLAQFSIDYDAENDPNHDLYPGYLDSVFYEINKKCDNLFELVELVDLLETKS